MITEHDLQEAIAECKGERNPNASTCIKLAAYYTILNNLQNDSQPQLHGYSFSPAPESYSNGLITYDSGTEFSNLIHGRSNDNIIPVIDELMTTLQVINPKLYRSVLRKL